MNETSIKYKITQRLKKEGYVVIRLRSTGESGWPDLLAIKFPGKCLWIETKTPEGKLSAIQIQKINLLNRLGFEVEVLNQ
jgi:Holliday junction resolvase